MDASTHACTRIIASLDDLVEQEAAALRNEDWGALVALQERISPLVDFLNAQLKGRDNSLDLRERIATLHARRNETCSSLAQTIEKTKHDLQQTHVIRRRVAQIAPAYAEASAASHRLQVVG